MSRKDDLDDEDDVEPSDTEDNQWDGDGADDAAREYVEGLDKHYSRRNYY